MANIIYAKNAFPDNLTQEEVDELVAEIQRLADSGELFDMSEAIDMENLEIEEPELYAFLMASEEIKEH